MAVFGCVADEAELLADEDLAEEAQDLVVDEPGVAEADGLLDLKAEQGATESVYEPDVLLVAPVAKWQYLVQPGPKPKTYGDCKVPYGDDWMKKDFYPMGGWEEGRAEFGYGESHKQTEVNPGPSKDKKCITQFFRHEFEVNDPDKFKSLTLRLLADDGAVVFLNGHEIARFNMPYGWIDADTPAKSTISGSDEDKFIEFKNIPADLLKEGKNVLAVEVHQVSRKDGDMTFAAELRGVLDPYDAAYRQTFSFASDEATIDESRPHTRLGGDSKCKVDGASGDNNSDPDKEQVCLSQWDLKSHDLYYDQIPAYSQVVAAHMVVKITNTSPERFPVVPLKTPWREQKVTWNDPGLDYIDWELGKFSEEDLEHRPVTVVSGLYKGTQVVTLPPELVQQWIDDPYENFGLAIVDWKHANGIDLDATGVGLKLVITVKPPPMPL